MIDDRSSLRHAEIGAGLSTDSNPLPTHIPTSASVMLLAIDHEINFVVGPTVWL